MTATGKPFREMSSDELLAEVDLWWGIATGPKGPGTPSNSARDGAMHLYGVASAWMYRRAREEAAAP
jgi:hypothetical protein